MPSATAHDPTLDTSKINMLIMSGLLSEGKQDADFSLLKPLSPLSVCAVGRGGLECRLPIKQMANVCSYALGRHAWHVHLPSPPEKQLHCSSQSSIIIPKYSVLLKQGL